MWYLGIFCAVLVGLGLLALQYPVFLDDFDKWGFQIKCGTGLGANLRQALDAGGAHADRCGTALLLRRLWAVPLITFGIIGLVAAAVVGSNSPSPREAQWV